MIDKVSVDVGIDAANKRYAIEVRVGKECVPVTASEATHLIANLSAATALILDSAQTASGAMSEARVSTPTTKTEDNRNGGVRWHREETGSYVAPLPGRHEARAKKGTRGWVAIIDGETVSETLSSKKAAVEAVEQAARERDIIKQ